MADGFRDVGSEVEESDINDESFKRIVTATKDPFDMRQTMNIKERTSYFIINAVLMSITHCFKNQDNREQNSKANLNILQRGMATISTLKNTLINLKDDDKQHIIDMAEFFQQNLDLCISDVTNGKPLRIKIDEYSP